MMLDNQIAALIAIGASVAANCRPSPGHNIGTALHCGVDDLQISQAVEIGRIARRGAAHKMDRFARSLGSRLPLPAGETDGCCACDSLRKLAAGGENG